MKKALTAIAMFVLVLSACRGESSDVADSPATLQEAMDQISAATRERTGAIEPVSAEELQQRLPEHIEELRRVEVTRVSSGAMGMNMSTTNARYSDEAGRSVTIAITDMAGMGSAGLMSAAAWGMTDFDRTTETGYDRTTRFDGFKAMESLSRTGGREHTQLAIIVGERFVVQLEGTGVRLEVLQGAARALGLRDLAGGG